LGKNDVFVQLSNIFPQWRFKIWHSSVVAFGREYEYGSKGLSQHSLPSSENEPEIFHFVCRTHLSQKQLESYINSVSSAYTKESYHVVGNNCNKFTKEICRFLCEDPDFPKPLKAQELITRGLSKFVRRPFS
jgi:hypothetical protein